MVPLEAGQTHTAWSEPVKFVGAVQVDVADCAFEARPQSVRRFQQVARIAKALCRGGIADVQAKIPLLAHETHPTQHG